MAEIGWIKLHRNFLEWEWYTDINVKLLAIHLLLKANITENMWQGMTIRRGSLITSLKALESETGLTRQKARTALSKLEKSGFCNKQITNGYTLITVCNFASYQDIRNTKQQTDNKQTTPPKEDKKASPEFCVPSLSELQAYCTAHALSVNPDKFFTHYSDKGWRAGSTPMQDWRAMLHRWHTNNLKRKQKKRREYDDINQTGTSTTADYSTKI